MAYRMGWFTADTENCIIAWVCGMARKAMQSKRFWASHEYLNQVTHLLAWPWAALNFSHPKSAPFLAELLKANEMLQIKGAQTIQWGYQRLKALNLNTIAEKNFASSHEEAMSLPPSPLPIENNRHIFNKNLLPTARHALVAPTKHWGRRNEYKINAMLRCGKKSPSGIQEPTYGNGITMMDHLPTVVSGLESFRVRSIRLWQWI